MDCLRGWYQHLPELLHDHFRGTTRFYRSRVALILILMSDQTFSGYYFRFCQILARNGAWSKIVQLPDNELIPELFANPRLSSQEKERLYQILNAERTRALTVLDEPDFWGAYNVNKPVLKQFGLQVSSPRRYYILFDSQYYQLTILQALQASQDGLNPLTKRKISQDNLLKLHKDLELELRCFKSALDNIKN